MNSLKIVSWNLLYRQGAAVCDIARVIEHQRPDLFLMQEATRDIDALPAIAGGRFYKLPWQGKTYSLALWAPEGEITTRALELPFSRLPGKFPPRVAQIVELDNFTIANVHLSHGQLLNRRQLRTIARAVQGPLAIIGDFNALGPLVMRGFKDVGPRRVTHVAKRVVPFRLDRCFVRDLKCVNARVLEKGPSDHRPIVLEIERFQDKWPRLSVSAEPQKPARWLKAIKKPVFGQAKREINFIKRDKTSPPAQGKTSPPARDKTSPSAQDKTDTGDAAYSRMKKR